MIAHAWLSRLDEWRAQIQAAITAHEHRLQQLRRQILVTGEVQERVARTIALLEKAIFVCQCTIKQIEATSRSFEETSKLVGYSSPPVASESANMLYQDRTTPAPSNRMSGTA